MPSAPGRFSERRFHAWLRRHLATGRSGPLPIGDDTAAVAIGPAMALLTTDAFVEGVHFLPSSPPRSVGRAVAAASLSDIAAKGGVPVALLLDLLLPPTTRPRWAQDVALGAESMMREFDGRLVGGDTKPSSRRSVVGTLIGVGDRRRLAPRSGARPGDRLVTTGYVGRGGWGALGLRAGRVPSRATVQRLLEIEPRVPEGRVLVRRAHAMLDTSDGIAESAHLLAEASHVRVTLDADRIPWQPELARRSPSASWREEVAFFGGDYELLAAVPEREVARALADVEEAGGRASVVGSVGRGRGAWIRRGTTTERLARGGWDPFAVGRTRPGRPRQKAVPSRRIDRPRADDDARAPP